MQYAFHLGQLVRVTRNSPGLMNGRIYCIVSLLPSEGDPVYRIKSMSGIEHLVRSDEIEPAALTAVP